MTIAKESTSRDYICGETFRFALNLVTMLFSIVNELDASPYSTFTSKLPIRKLRALRWVFALALWSIALICAPPASALNPPSVSPSTGSYITQQTVTMTASSGTIYYTTDGSLPTNSSTQYVGAFAVSNPTQINAVTYSSGIYSPITTVYLDVDPALAPILQTSLLLRLRSGLGCATTVGAPASVSEWFDLSGNGNNAVAASASQPTFKNSVMNQLPAVNFNGTSQYLSLPAGFGNFNSGFTMLMVFQPTSLTGGAHMIDLGDSEPRNELLFQVASSGSYGQFSAYNGTTGASAQSSAALAANQTQLLAAIQSSTTATAYLNGTPGTANASMPSIPNIIRPVNFIGRASAGGNYYAGYVAEILVYSSALTTSQFAAVEAYLLQKYQLPSSTPETPIISVPTGTLSGPTAVEIATQYGSTTYITTDGTTPTSSSPIYCGCPLSINYSQTLKAISILNGVQSSVASATYTLSSSQWPAPSATDMTAPTINLQLPAPAQ